METDYKDYFLDATLKMQYTFYNPGDKGYLDIIEHSGELKMSPIEKITPVKYRVKLSCNLVHCLINPIQNIRTKMVNEAEFGFIVISNKGELFKDIYGEHALSCIRILIKRANEEMRLFAYTRTKGDINLPIFSEDKLHSLAKSITFSNAQ
jgi:hypothetical protein